MNKEFDKQLNYIFYNPKIGYISINKFYDKVKQIYPKITYEYVRNWYNQQPTNQIFTNKMDKIYYKITSKYNKVGSLVGDLLDLSNLKRHNKNYRYIFNIIDTHSRYVWSFAMKSKKVLEVLDNFKKVIKEIKNKYPKNIIIFTSDDGSEFKGNFKRYLSKNKIEHYIGNPKDNTKLRTSLIERFHRTLLNLIRKYQYNNKNLNWIDKLNDLIENYNNTKHKTIKNKPIDIYLEKIKYKEKKEKIIDILNLGDIVRIRKKTNIFSKKGREIKYSEQLYKIVERKRIRYKLQNIKTNKYLQSLYLPRQLLKVEIKENKENNNNYSNILEENERVNKFIRKQKKENLGNIDEKGNIKLKHKIKSKRKIIVGHIGQTEIRKRIKHNRKRNIKK